MLLTTFYHSVIESRAASRSGGNKPTPRLLTGYARTVRGQKPRGAVPNRTLLIVIAIFSNLFVVARTLRAQAAPSSETGLPPFASFHGSDFDQINLQNGNLHMEIPVKTMKERGRTLTWRFVYNSPIWSKIWFPQPPPPPSKGINGVYGVKAPSLGTWGFLGPFSWFVGDIGQDVTCTSTTPTIGYRQYTNFTVTDPSGTIHTLPLRKEDMGSSGASQCLGSTLKGPALDGSGIVYDAGNNIITLADGTQITGSIHDPNGNELSPTADSFDQPVVTITQGPNVTLVSPLGVSLPSRPQYTLYGFLDSTGTTQTFRADYEAIDFQSNLCTTVPGSPNFPCNETSGVDIVVSQIVLPNGKKYAFNYQNASFGQLIGVTTPTGATLSFAYTPNFWPQVTGGLTLPNYVGRQAVASRMVSSAGQNSTWSYTYGSGSTTVSDPFGNATVHTYAGVSAGNAISTNLVEHSVSYYAGTATSGTLLKTVATDYAGEVEAGVNVANVRPIRHTITLDNGLQTRVETDYETFSYTSVNEVGGTGTATRMNPTEIREFAYASGAPGPLLRRTDYTYLHTGSATYTNLNIVNRKTSILVYDGSGTLRSKTLSEFDNYTAGDGHHQSIQPSGVIQHDPAFGTAYTTRGNITAISHWRNTDGALLTSYLQYDDAGNVLVTMDANGHATSYDYTDSWSAASGGQRLRSARCGPEQGPPYKNHQCPESNYEAHLLFLHRAYRFHDGPERVDDKPDIRLDESASCNRVARHRRHCQFL
jgi:hypothetical protein